MIHLSFEAEYALQEFREEEPDLFDAETGEAFTNVYLTSAATRMKKVIDLLEAEVQLLLTKINAA